MRLVMATGVLALVVVLGARRAAAYPEFQFSTGATRCSECHFAPAGGGLINAYGRDEAGSTISSGGDGRFLHGALELPEAVALGGDFRLATFGKRVRGGNEATVFPMQADIYARLALSGISVNVTAGVLGAIREPAPMAERLGSREHFVMYEPDGRTWCVRAGRAFPVFGLRLPDHTAYVRRYTGRHSLEETYLVGGGISRERFELHASLVTPIAIHPVVGRHAWGGVVHAERIGDASSISAQLDVRRDDDSTRSWLGGTWKRWFEDADVMLAGELDTGLVVTADERVAQLAGLAMLAYRPGKPWGIAGAAHYFDPDAQLLGQERAAIDGRFTWFPRAHFELSALVRTEAAVTELSRASVLGFLQLHYYL